MLKITLKGGDVREVMENTTVEALCREISMGPFPCGLCRPVQRQGL